VFQAHNLLPDFTALENVMFPAAIRKGETANRTGNEASELLRRVGLAGKRRLLAAAARRRRLLKSSPPLRR
jgi:lipoprotein-releasing system ATP-binding protein